jgi:CDK inhibitor PHO81
VTANRHVRKTGLTLDLDPVLLCNDLGIEQAMSEEAEWPLYSSGRTTISVKEAVRIAQSNNFMGLMCSSRLLVSGK